MDTFAKFGTFCSLLYQVTKLLRQQLPLGWSIKYLLKDLSHFLSVPFLFWKSSEMPNIKRFSWEKEKRLTSWQIAQKRCLICPRGKTYFVKRQTRMLCILEVIGKCKLLYIFLLFNSNVYKRQNDLILIRVSKIPIYFQYRFSVFKTQYRY